MPFCLHSRITGGAPLSVTFCDTKHVSTPFQFTVDDTFLIEGSGLALSPFFPVDRYRFDSQERVRIETPDGPSFEADAEFEIPLVTPVPKVFQAVCLVRGIQKSQVPVGSRVTVLNKSAEQIASPNGGPLERSGNSGVAEGPPSVS